MDYNSDKENWARKEYIVMNATKTRLDGIDVDGKTIRFDKLGRTRITDPGMADEIRKTYGKAVTVTRVRHPSPVSDRGHRYFFGEMPEMPWKRIEREKRESEETQNVKESE